MRGLQKNTSFDVLKVNVRLSAGGRRFHVDTLDLYQARARSAFVAAAGAITGAARETLESDLNELITRLEMHQQKAISAVMEPMVNGPICRVKRKPRHLRSCVSPGFLSASLPTS